MSSKGRVEERNEVIAENITRLEDEISKRDQIIAKMQEAVANLKVLIRNA